MIKERLGIKFYGRYMDDFFLIHPDKDYLIYCLEEIKSSWSRGAGIESQNGRGSRYPGDRLPASGRT